MDQLSDGQRQAVQQLQHIAKMTEGRVRLEAVTGSEPETALIRISVDCSGPDERKSLVTLQDREPFIVLVPVGFPFLKPEVQTPHDRFAHLPNVMWGRSICLYLAENEWNPSEGMHDFVARLLTWLGALADGSLTGPQLPWHPPLTNQLVSPGSLIVGADVPDEVTEAWALVEAIGGNRYEVRRWFADRPSRPPAGLPAGRYFLAPLLVLPQPVGFDYPSEFEHLVRLLVGQRIPAIRVRDLRVRGRPDDRPPWWIGPTGPDARPLHLMILGSPAPHRTASRAAVAHLAVWEVNVRYGENDQGLAWMTVFDQRPQTATRRDTSRPVTWLAGKRIVVLGCGGLGAPVAEACVRAGASAIRLVDNGEVTPGILVRQPFTYADIGRPKAEAFAERLRAIAPMVTVDAQVTNAALLRHLDLREADLIVDATANPAVSAALEFAYWSYPDGPPLLSMVVGHECDRGIVTVARPGASGAGADLLRRLGLAAAEDDDLGDLLDDFFPDRPRTALFQPEPGCSDPTYVGSATDLAMFAGGLLNEGVAVLGADTAPDTLTPQRFAGVLQLSGAYETAPAPRRFLWLNDHKTRERGLGYQVRFAPEVLAAMRVEALRTAEARGPGCETGGLLLGQIHHGARVVWVSEADSLPPESRADAHELSMNPRSVDAFVAARRRRSRGLLGYVGAWHTHPGGAAWPSDLDERALELLISGGAASLMVIVGGPPEVWSPWLDGRGRPHVYTRLGLPG